MGKAAYADILLHMSYPSIDKLQQSLARDVFHYTKDAKKAAGRALGTLVEIITFYLLKDWGLEENTRIEKRLIEYRNAAISHNVEYTLHPVRQKLDIGLAQQAPTTSSKIMTAIKYLGNVNLEKFHKLDSSLFTTSDIIKNACVVARGSDSSLVAVVKRITDEKIEVVVTEQIEKPFAMVECKRVGIEEGNKKGPQTIEKAKQGAYVARTVSSLQKVRNIEGTVYGVLPLGSGKFRFEEYDKLLDEIVSTNDKEVYKDFILTVGVVSNHGNWFTSDNPNKELAVLRDAYDWLLFLTDSGIAMFINELLLHPRGDYYKVQQAFLASYASTGQTIRKKGKNQFTKTQINREADLLLQEYFKSNRRKIEKWMNVLTPKQKSLGDLKAQLNRLNAKNWNI